MPIPLTFHDNVLPPAYVFLLHELIEKDVTYWAREFEEMYMFFCGWEMALTALEEAIASGEALAAKSSRTLKPEWLWHKCCFGNLPLQRRRYLSCRAGTITTNRFGGPAATPAFVLDHLPRLRDPFSAATRFPGPHRFSLQPLVSPADWFNGRVDISSFAFPVKPAKPPLTLQPTQLPPPLIQLVPPSSPHTTAARAQIPLYKSPQQAPSPYLTVPLLGRFGRLPEPGDGDWQDEEKKKQEKDSLADHAANIHPGLRFCRGDFPSGSVSPSDRSSPLPFARASTLRDFVAEEPPKDALGLASRRMPFRLLSWN